MDHWGQAWRNLRQRLASGQPLSDTLLPYETDTPADPDVGVPGCPICKGIGWATGEKRTRQLEGGHQEVYFPAIPCVCRRPAIEAARAVRLRRYANLPHEAVGESPRTLGSFNAARDPAAYEKAANFAEGSGPNILTVVGTFGAGKSHLLEGIGRRLIERGVVTRYEFVPDLLDRIRATYNPNAEEQTGDVQDEYRSVEALLLDDLGAHQSTPWARAQLVGLIDHCYRNGRALAVTSNLLTPEAMAANLDGRVASRLFDRHSGSVAVAVMTCPDYRLEDRR